MDVEKACTEQNRTEQHNYTVSKEFPCQNLSNLSFQRKYVVGILNHLVRSDGYSAWVCQESWVWAAKSVCIAVTNPCCPRFNRLVQIRSVELPKTTHLPKSTKKNKIIGELSPPSIFYFGNSTDPFRYAKRRSSFLWKLNILGCKLSIKLLKMFNIPDFSKLVLMRLRSRFNSADDVLQL